MKRVLIVATVAPTIGQFNMNNLRILNELGYKFDVACDYKDVNVWSEQKSEDFKKQIKEFGGRVIQVDFSRNIWKLAEHVRALQQIKCILENENYLFVHTHTPIASSIVRYAAHRSETKVIYTAHGFHFYKGAPLKNWLLYYPVEKILSYWTDVLVTINREDYVRASKYFRAKKTVYIPGIGINVNKFKEDHHGKTIRSELGISNDTFMLFSVGELNKNKNHMVVIKALKELPQNIVYVIAGNGGLKDQLTNLAEREGVSARVRLVGYRSDINDFYHAADAFILPSLREGLNVSLMEAMASSLPCLAGNIRGNTDLIDDGKGGYLFSPLSKEEVRNTIKCVFNDDHRDRLGDYNFHKVKKFDIERVERALFSLYGSKMFKWQE